MGMNLDVSVVGRFAIFCQPQKNIITKSPSFFVTWSEYQSSWGLPKNNWRNSLMQQIPIRHDDSNSVPKSCNEFLRRCAWEVVTWKSYIAVYCSATPPCSISRLTHLYKIHFPSLCLRLPDGRLLKDKKNTHVRRATNRISNTVISQNRFSVCHPWRCLARMVLSSTKSCVLGFVTRHASQSAHGPAMFFFHMIWWGKRSRKNIKWWLKSNSLHFQWFCWWQDSTVWLAFLCWTFWRWKWLFATTIIFCSRGVVFPMFPRDKWCGKWTKWIPLSWNYDSLKPRKNHQNASQEMMIFSSHWLVLGCFLERALFQPVALLFGPKK